LPEPTNAQEARYDLEKEHRGINRNNAEREQAYDDYVEQWGKPQDVVEAEDAVGKFVNEKINGYYNAFIDGDKGKELEQRAQSMTEAELQQELDKLSDAPDSVDKYLQDNEATYRKSEGINQLLGRTGGYADVLYSWNLSEAADAIAKKRIYSDALAAKQRDENDLEFRTAEEANDGNSVESKHSLMDVVHTLYTKGKDAAGKLFQRSFFDVVETPNFMKKLGLTGDKFTIKYGVIARHLGKDASHNLSEKVWEQLPEALKHPFAISKLSVKDNSYRIYTSLKNDKGEYVVVGVDVKNGGRNIEVNAIATVFGRREGAGMTATEELVYKDKEITPEQQALLDGPNFRQYPAAQELSADKGTTNSADKQANSENNLEFRTAEEGV
jgi:hypothetical protein